MKSAEIRQSFLDFFESKQHTIVRSASLMPQSPGLLFTNAGMNQFVPYFLGTEKASYSPPRAADTQKCIRAGGKHNDLEDVGYDTYHHTFFEMLGNWSFGDYFKKEAIEWGWELIVDVWGTPPERLYATVYEPSEGDPSVFDQEAYNLWAELFAAKGLDPKKHIISGNAKDNFWMMGETGPCGPCSELHVDLTPSGDSQGSLVNQDSDMCIEIWNLVFIQYNAEENGSFRDLPAKHIDTGMGFERACSLIQNTKGFTDFSKKPSNYATDVFQPIFRSLEKLSGKKYIDIYPGKEIAHSDTLNEAIAFRVIADHIRTLTFSIADGIKPGNTGRNYVLRRILRRAVKYGRTLGFDGSQPFLPSLVKTIVNEFGAVFPELKKHADTVIRTLTDEESNFNKTLDRGIQLFESTTEKSNVFSAKDAFKLYDTYGFPTDLTALLCRERGIALDESAVENYMQAQRERARAAQKKTIVRALNLNTDVHTEFVGFDNDNCEARILEVHAQDEQVILITNCTVLFTEMGGQDSDRGTAIIHGQSYPINAVQKMGYATAHMISEVDPKSLSVGDTIQISIDTTHRASIEAHHTATHLLHWALHKVISADISQQGSSVSSARLRFDFNSKALSTEHLSGIENLVNERIGKGDDVYWQEVTYDDVKHRQDIMQFFGDKYGNKVRVVQIGGKPHALNGYSMELCGGTHVKNTAEIGLFKIKSESAISSGIRRIEALCGAAAESYIAEQEIKESAAKTTQLNKLKLLNLKLSKLDQVTFLVDPSASAEQIKATSVAADRALKKALTANAAKIAKSLLEVHDTSKNCVIAVEGSVVLLQELLSALKLEQYEHAAFLIINDHEKLHIGVICGELARCNNLMAGQLLQSLAPIAGGKGGGKPEMARGAASEVAKFSALKKAALNKLS